MSEFSRETLLNIIETDHVQCGEASALARMALAAMGSETAIADCDPEVYEKGVSVCLVAIPKETAEVICQNITAATGCKVDWHYFGGRVQIKALRVASQPAPVLPEEITSAIEGLKQSLVGCNRYNYCFDAVTRVENACRAAMLTAAPQSPGGDPATVPGKWISVSERMPEDEQEVLTINKMGHRFVSFFDKHSGLFFDRLDAPAACCIEHVLVTHWMPLPAAPQEVKGE
ncbi:TPA: DUF551 domain-containing protein [Escherichia coli]|nr:DUF551 domain-containing protein [Escherichia coli]UMV91032.1 DUF551 domain-containing protein [Escherichia coli]HAH0632525.1 DUF551 domain-containing protein [Escherichia coli]HBB5103879.1 DUF551 domain-containing protein [Escherichia coli]